MAKRITTNLLILLAYSIPYAFLAMYGDTEYSIVWLYLLPLCCLSALGWYCGKQKRIPLAAAGNLISCGLSLLLAYRFLMGKKPFLQSLRRSGNGGLPFRAFPVRAAADLAAAERQPGSVYARAIFGSIGNAVPSGGGLCVRRIGALPYFLVEL